MSRHEVTRKYSQHVAAGDTRHGARGTGRRGGPAGGGGARGGLLVPGSYMEVHGRDACASPTARVVQLAGFICTVVFAGVVPRFLYHCVCSTPCWQVYICTVAFVAGLVPEVCLSCLLYALLLKVHLQHAAGKFIVPVFVAGWVRQLYICTVAFVAAWCCSFIFRHVCSTLAMKSDFCSTPAGTFTSPP